MLLGAAIGNGQPEGAGCMPPGGRRTPVRSPEGTHRPSGVAGGRGEPHCQPTGRPPQRSVALWGVQPRASGSRPPCLVSSVQRESCVSGTDEIEIRAQRGECFFEEAHDRVVGFSRRAPKRQSRAGSAQPSEGNQNRMIEGVQPEKPWEHWRSASAAKPPRWSFGVGRSPPKEDAGCYLGATIA